MPLQSYEALQSSNEACLSSLMKLYNKAMGHGYLVL